jgi:hypothetical protein
MIKNLKTLAQTELRTKESIKDPKASFTPMLHKQHGKGLLMIRYHT